MIDIYSFILRDILFNFGVAVGSFNNRRLCALSLKSQWGGVIVDDDCTYFDLKKGQ
jgi:hypothetical protein